MSPLVVGEWITTTAKKKWQIPLDVSRSNMRVDYNYHLARISHGVSPNNWKSGLQPNSVFQNGLLEFLPLIVRKWIIMRVE
jgi:hypothetical protein